MVLPSGFIQPCLPSKVARPPSGPLWVDEIKHDGYRLMVRWDGVRIRCFTRGGHDWADRFPAIVDAALRIKAQSFLIDGEAVIARDDGTPDFHALRSRRRGHEGVAEFLDTADAPFLIDQKGGRVVRLDRRISRPIRPVRPSATPRWARRPRLGSRLIAADLIDLGVDCQPLTEVPVAPAPRQLSGQGVS